MTDSEVLFYLDHVRPGIAQQKTRRERRVEFERTNVALAYCVICATKSMMYFASAGGVTQSL